MFRTAVGFGVSAAIGAAVGTCVGTIMGVIFVSVINAEQHKQKEENGPTSDLPSVNLSGGPYAVPTSPPE